MRTPRIAILSLFVIASVFLFCRSASSLSNSDVSTGQQAVSQSGIRSLLAFSTPFSLFPPNAAITLTDDNSTSFPARPAAFGPALPAKGLSGELWIGKGFPDVPDNEGDGDGELGCNDLPGYNGSPAKWPAHVASSLNSVDEKRVVVDDSKSLRRGDMPAALKHTSKKPSTTQSTTSHNDDGTDDYLHQAVAPKQSGSDMATMVSSHADIQSMQETAEITGKVVMLSRGGCGFLEKVKWAQRRGATAVIVGDSQKGGPLIQMFARGDTSNVTIPAIFTSRTTAHLLASLVVPGSYIEDFITENGNVVAQVQIPDKSKGESKAKAALQSTTTKENSNIAGQSESGHVQKTAEKLDLSPTSKLASKSWLSRVLRLGGDTDDVEERSETSKSSPTEWTLIDSWDDVQDQAIRQQLERSSRKQRASSRSKKQSASMTDGFEIGVQDWRDPDLAAKMKHGKSDKSGDHARDYASTRGSKSGKKASASDDYASIPVRAKGHDGGKASASRLAHNHLEDGDAGSAGSKSTPKSAAKGVAGAGDAVHTGLWITITPTASGSPIFDTLLVIVISPLITLTVVYSLLIIRAKIRRRRWRAPKSVVERLPVRTYHTRLSPTPSQISRLPSPVASSPTTPLLQSSSRPRSRTASGIPQADDFLRAESSIPVPRPSSRNELEKDLSSSWKKYMGRQVECVVCLEEYIDGVSRVMSLPCGHEFHAECITPWLTTRRRTCPICKGDVVRSLARGMPSSPRYEPYRDDDVLDVSLDDDDTQAQRDHDRAVALFVHGRSADAETSSGSPYMDRSRSPLYDVDSDEDVEQGGLLASPDAPISSSPPRRRSSRSGPGPLSTATAWLGSLASSVGSVGGRMMSGRNTREREAGSEDEHSR